MDRRSLEIARQLRKESEKYLKVIDMRIFGSRTRDDFEEDSDLDVYIELEEALLVDKQFVGSKHSGVLSFFDKEFVDKGVFPKRFSEIFHKTFDMRGKSDYKEFVEYSYEKMESLLSEAKKFVS
jgi:hypothetical protein